MIRGFSRRGQPLAVLAMVLGGWVSARAMMWDASAMPMVAQRPALPDPASTAQAGAAALLPALVRTETAEVTPTPEVAPAHALAALPKAVQWLGSGAHKLADKVGTALVWDPAIAPAPAAQPAWPSAGMPAYALAPRAAVRMVRGAPARSGSGAGLALADPIIIARQPIAPAWAEAPAPLAEARLQPASYTPYSSFVFPGAPGSAQVFNPPAAAPPAIPPERPRARRWSADSWYYWRRGTSAGLSPGAFAPSYGASQAGGVLRYRIAPSSGHKPTIFVRTTAALNGSSEREAAAGLSARPFGRVPIVVAGEARYTQTPQGNLIRPAGFAYTELPPFPLPIGLRGELYAQGGYVGGTNATLFVDGSLRADRKLFGQGRPEVRLGGGVWGGAQKGAARLDVGPSIIVTTPVGKSVSARLAADWRFRLTGDAAPDSGPAVTLSAGF